MLTDGEKLEQKTTIMSDTATRGIRVRVKSEYVAEKSSPSNNYYFFSYHVRIDNEGTTAAQLVSREWIITDSEGRIQQVSGSGVVGQQPTLGPGESFEYTSFCPLNTPVGSMHGSYRMLTLEGEEFDAKIQPFTLAVPTAVN